MCVCALPAAASLSIQGVGRIASYYGSSPSSGGGACGGGGVLNAQERAALGHHAGCIELIEAMLVGEANWRPGADQVVLRTQRLLELL